MAGVRFGVRMSVVSLMLVALVGASLMTATTASSETSRGAMAAVRGLDLTVFGRPVTISSSTAATFTRTTARASASGVTVSKGTTTTKRVDGINKREAAEACLPEVALFDVLHVERACGEARVQTLPPLFTEESPRHNGATLGGPPPPAAESGPVDNGGPQAIGRGSVAGVDLRDANTLQPAVTQLRNLVGALTPLQDQTIAAAATRVGPMSAVLLPLAASLGFRTTDSVGPVAGVLVQLLDGTQRATRLASIRLADSTAQANTDAGRVVVLANAGGGQIDLLPGAAPDGAPLLSVIVGEARSTASYDRATTGRAPTFQPAPVRVQLGLPLTGGEKREMEVRPDTPLTLLAGTKLETTVAVGSGNTLQSEDGSVSSWVDGTTVRLLQGVKGGVELRLGHAESSMDGRFDPRRTSPAAGGSERWMILLGAALVFATGAAVALYVIGRSRSSSGI